MLLTNVLIFPMNYLDFFSGQHVWNCLEMVLFNLYFKISSLWACNHGFWLFLTDVIQRTGPWGMVTHRDCLDCGGCFVHRQSLVDIC